MPTYKVHGSQELYTACDYTTTTTHVHKHAHAHIRTHVHTLAHTACIRTHAHTYAHTHACMHTHTTPLNNRLRFGVLLKILHSRRGPRLLNILGVIARR